MSNRAVAREIDVSHSTISRALKGDQLDMATLEKFAAFLDIPVSTLVDMDVQGSAGLAAKVEAIVAQEPELGKVFEEACDLILDGKMTPDVFRDLIAYASFRMGQAAE